MALLYRFVKLQDRAQSHVFTFVVTKSVTRDLERDVTSKEFSCGHQRWAITFSRTDKVVGVYLVWRTTSEAMRVYVDFTFTLLNREHFSVNEAFSGKQVKFTLECPAQGNRNYIPVSDLYGRNFTDANGEFQLELSMGHVRTVFDTEFRVPQTLFGHALTHRHAHASSKTSSAAGSAAKLETSYFTFGGFDWNLALYPYGTKDLHGGGEGRVSVYLNRCTGFDHQCRVRYSVVLGDADRRIDSGVVDDVSDSDGKSYGWHPRARFNDLIYKGVVRVHLEMLLANTLSEVISSFVFPGCGGSGGGGGGVASGVVAAPAVTQCYDRDKQAWSIKSDCQSETVRLHMVYKDIHNVPRNHLRYVCWTAYLLRFHGKSGHVEPVPLPGAPFSHYYAQESSDEGIIMETDIGVKELREPNCPYLTDKGQLRVQVEWEESYLLFQATYHKYDDVSRLHNQQMRREIMTLQAENYSLERQLFSYQKSIAFAHSRGGGYSDQEGTPEGGRGDDEEPPYFDERALSYSRSLSTDTEYA
ncbi:uncharacterized protein LOC111043531 [Nilaparvata lugens]|uniref:uncharacterized protein LOC111043531 n=1 Tax=Nilaparvata lugens TaxID=108931 RepID=UPI00193D2E9B|nr:uncharacterized protein LOC111043531 [Nilaparvata lugens]